MENVIKYVTGFFSGLLSIMMAVVPVAILWNVLTGGMIFGMDVIANLTTLLNSFGEGGFVGLVALVILAKFFIDKK
jgi:hypothetical protein|tara:strand:- start:181 stop:408 length:228 start_codon:yes stop_codon:yes gene_type:complete